LSTTRTNIHGRKPGRGVRPWLLLPKVIAVGTFLGSYAATLFVWVNGNITALEPGDPRRMWTIDTVGRLIRWLVVPALLVAIVFGVLLFLQHPRPFMRMRWLKVKLTMLLILTPAAHFFLFSRLAILRAAEARGISDDLAADQFTFGLSVALLGYVLILILGRLKPRLGQNIAGVFPAPAPRAADPG
jgi:uncharacterized membrane protein